MTKWNAGQPLDISGENVDENGMELVNLINVTHTITNLPGADEADENVKRKRERRLQVGRV